MSTVWRTSGDIIYWGQSPSMDRVLANFDSAQHPSAQSPGGYNDLDMLVVGMPGFSAAQNRTHMGLWAVSGAPLLAGNNLATMSPETRAILANREVLAIDQDLLGRQGTKVAEDHAGRQVEARSFQAPAAGRCCCSTAPPQPPPSPPTGPTSGSPVRRTYATPGRAPTPAL